MTEPFPTPSETHDLESLRRGQEIEVGRDGSLYVRGIIDDIDLDLGVLWIHDHLNERKMINTPEFSVRPSII